MPIRAPQELEYAAVVNTSIADLAATLSEPYGWIRLYRHLRNAVGRVLMHVAGAYRRYIATRPRVVVVTGTYGKTTATRALGAALGTRGLQRTNGNSGVSLARALLRIRNGDRHAVLEVGVAKPGEMEKRVAVIRPDIAVVMSIGSEHLRSFGTLEVTRDEKAAAVRALPRDGLAILNGDDPNVLWMQDQTRASVTTFGFAEHNDVRATKVALDWPHGTTFTLHANGVTRSVRTRLVGTHLVYPFLAAIAAVVAEGLPLGPALARLTEVEPVNGRMQVIPLANGAILLRDDFKSGLETIDVALDTLAEIPARRRVVVIGDVAEPPGSQGPIYRRIGERIGQVAGRAILVTSRRNQSSYAGGARSAGLPREQIVNAGHGVRRALEVLRQDLEAGDVVLIKGRDTQRLDRISLALVGREVRCEREFCRLRMPCDDCNLLSVGRNPRL